MVDAALCKRIIERAERRGFSTAGALYPRSYRNNDRLVIDDGALAAQIFERLRVHLPAVIDDGTLHGLNHRFRFCRYRGEQCFRRHRDGAHHAAAGLSSKLTFMIYLSGDHEGGVTRFYDSAQARTPAFVERPVRGDVLLFDHRWWHDGAAVQRGTKYVMRSDVMYRVPRQTRGHRGYIWSLAEHDGVVYSGGRDNTVRRYPSGEVVRRHPSSVLSLASDGAKLWSGSRDGTLQLTHANRGGYAPPSPDERTKARPALRQRQRIAPRQTDSLASPDGSSQIGERVIDTGGAVLSIAPPLSAGADGVLRREGVPWRQAHRDWIWDLSRDGDGWLTASEDGTAARWSAGGALVERWELGVPLRSVLAHRGAVFVGAADGAVWRLARDGQRWAMPLHRGAVRALVAVGDRIASGGEDGQVKLWCDSEAGVVHIHDDFVSALLHTVDGQSAQLLSAGYDGVIRAAQLDLSEQQDRMCNHSVAHASEHGMRRDAERAARGADR